MAVAAARLQQQDPDIRIGAQAIGQHAAGRAAADDDVVRDAGPVRHRHQSRGIARPPSTFTTLPLAKPKAPLASYGDRGEHIAPLPQRAGDPTSRSAVASAGDLGRHRSG